ncbi:MAG: CpsD/CapB family tyrosine-protein kinase [Myxococcota bacterium]
MGEISEALERARQEEARQREERRKRRTSEVADSLRQAAVESALKDPDGATAAGFLPEVTVEEPPAAEPREEASEPSQAQRADAELAGAELAGGVDLHPNEPSVLTSSNERMEQCRHLANRVASEMERRSIRTLALVSALRMEGKSTVSSSLALSTATLSQGRSVALVDLDLRRPTIASKLGLSVEVGVESVIQGQADLDRVRIPVEHPKIDIYPALPARVPAHELLVLPGFARLISALAERYTAVFIDTPPVLLVPDANLILKRVDACLGVARSGVSRARNVRQMVDLLPKDRLLGTLLNATAAPKLNSENYSYYTSDPMPEGSS